MGHYSNSDFVVAIPLVDQEDSLICVWTGNLAISFFRCGFILSAVKQNAKQRRGTVWTVSWGASDGNFQMNCL